MNAWYRHQEVVDGRILGYSERPASSGAVLFLHGLGSNRSDFRPAGDHPGFASRRLVIPDLPGHGDSPYQPGGEDVVNATASILSSLVTKLGLDRIAVVGHSLGAAIAVPLIESLGRTVSEFVNIEGNLVETDCGILSHKIERLGKRLPGEDFFEEVACEVAATGLNGACEFAKNFRRNLNSAVAWRDYCVSLIRHSTDGNLLQRFLALDCRRLYIHGAAETPGVVSELQTQGIEVSAIADSGHWPMYANPAALFDRIASYLTAPTRP